MRIYLKNKHAKHDIDPIWNDGALGFLKRSPQQNNNEMSSDIGSVPDSKTHIGKNLILK